jgi:cellulose synthase/poly-beta-1,6-N-acetylglucosamine synthase-like glycosyltransferase
MSVFRHVLAAVQWGFLGYFVVLNVFYLGLAFIAMYRLRRYMGGVAAAERVYTHLQMPVSLVVPAYNEEGSIATSIRALLQLRYQHFEIIVVNDGSTDGTLATMIREFELAPFPEAYQVRIKTRPVRGLYRSLKYPNLRVVDKENGGKADASNAGLNTARYPIFYCGDADSVLEVRSLEHVVRPFLEDPRTVACGGTVRIVNGCRVRGGVIEEVGLPKNPLALLQVVEYLRAFLGGRLGWSAINGLLIVSGAFGVFHRETVVAAGGFRADVIGEDMELVVRLHRHLAAQGQRYRVSYIPDPVCWTEAPEDLPTLAKQRQRWQRGLAQSLWENRQLAFARGSGAAGWLAFPFFVVFELLSPLVELVGLAVMAAAWLAGGMAGMSLLAFVAAAFALGVMLSTTALLLEELSFHTYPKARHLLVLFLVSLLENFGYRQLNSWWRLQALWGWMRGENMQWGVMKRNASWQQQ